MAEFKPPAFGEEPRKESPGEAQQRYASLVQQVAGLAGFELSQEEQQKIGRFITTVVAQLTPEQQKALGEIIGKLIAWGVKRYMSK